MQYDEFLFSETGDGEINLTLVVAEFSDMPLSFQKIVCWASTGLIESFHLWREGWQCFEMGL